MVRENKDQRRIFDAASSCIEQHKPRRTSISTMIADMDQEGKQQLLFSRQRQSEGTSKSVRQQSSIVNVGVRLHRPRFQLVDIYNERYVTIWSCPSVEGTVGVFDAQIKVAACVDTQSAPGTLRNGTNSLEYLRIVLRLSRR